LIVTWSAALVAAATLSGANAQTSPRPDDWQYRFILYGYFPSIGGSTTFPAGTGSSVNVDADTILEHLKFTFMGTFEVRKGHWGGFTDLLYMDLGGSKSETRDVTIDGVQLPAGVTAGLQLDLKGTVWTLAGTYRMIASPESTVDVFGGARLINLREKLGWEFSANVGPIDGPGREGSSEQKLENWDGIVGVKGRLAFGPGREWFVPYYADVGTGESDLTWQAIGGIGYAFNWGEILAVWRYLDYDFKSGKKIESINFNGPAVGVAFRW
jgi:hypothetical protein